MATVTNQTSSPALRSQDALVTCTPAAFATNAALIFIGQKCTTAGSKVGYISEIPIGSPVFKVKPQYPSGYFDSAATPGILNATEVITFG